MPGPFQRERARATPSPRCAVEHLVGGYLDQAWINVAGLSLDFLGFILLLREWWIGFLSESSLLAHEEALERQQRLRAFASQNASDPIKRHLATAGQMQDDASIRQARDQRRAAMRGRRFWFISATLLIIAGFLLQVLAALPVELFSFAP